LRLSKGHLLRCAPSRRQFLQFAALGGAAVLAGSVVDRAYNVDPLHTGSLRDVDHIVLLMHENRSFDHYFGTMSDVRGYAHAGAVLRQRGYQPGVGRSARGTLLPYRLDSRLRPGVDTDVIGDPRHDWRTQHASWNRGRMDAWMTTHAAVDGPYVAPEVMGYYTRADIPIHYALADAFTVCDHYFSSVLGPTAPNRLFWMTGTLDPDGLGGGPITGRIRNRAPYSLTWRTFPEVLQEAGVSWKIYNEAPAAAHSALSGMVHRFRAYRDPESQLHARGITPRYPDDFIRDVMLGRLPSVSWIIPSIRHSEHPSYPPETGALSITRVLAALVANPAVWERSALIVSYDENGGLFDHVAPPVPPAGTPGEFVPRDAIAGPDEPIGLGFRVPCLVLSPFTRGCYVSSQTFDHTSQLRLVGARFGVEVPNVSQWRRTITGDMTRLFQHGTPPDPSIPTLGGVRAAADDSPAGDRTAEARAAAGRLPHYPIGGDGTPRQAILPRRHRL
jgi:phospholipase C